MSVAAAVGMSMGSESFVVATCPAGATRCEVVANDAGHRATPTYVAIVAGEVLIGEGAKGALVRYPMQTVPHLLPLSSADVVREGKFRVSCDVNVREFDDRVEISGLTDEEGTVHEATNLLSQFLARMKSSTVDGACGNAPMQSVVLSVPRYLPIEGVKAIVESAGFTNTTIQVIYADDAAVLAYQSTLLEAKTHRCALVVDWGATTCTLSVMGLVGGAIQYVSHSVSYSFGARVIDKELQRQIALAFQKKTRMDPTDNARAMRKLLIAAEECKMILSTATMTSVEIEAFCEGMDLKEPMSRMKIDIAIRDKGLPASFDALLEGLLEQVAEEGLAHPIDAVVLAGGALKIPLLAQHVKNSISSRAASGKFSATVATTVTVLDQIATDEVSAVGACTQAVVLNASKAGAPLEEEQPIHVLGCSIFLPAAAIADAPVKDGALLVPQASLTTLFSSGTPLPADVSVAFPAALTAAQLVPVLVQAGQAEGESVPVQAVSSTTVELPSGTVKATFVVSDTNHASVVLHVISETADGTKTVLTKEAPLEFTTA
ncbi:heat shock protein 70, putative [Bodo saltans]|uniref:Heat shock protein 70, putative n=1 Tax=Bodo saltans TaxID=75058 RepID=A0A0S4IR51_BODSA|nr:heat shock protein 70, putative [Bodo saltans]|eukprot:CUF01340.1 heat shock protein 70, putative [Bodo saltans]